MTQFGSKCSQHLFFFWVHFHMCMNLNMWVSFNLIINFPHAPFVPLCVELGSLSIDFKFSIINYIEKYVFIPYGKLMKVCHNNYWVFKDNWVAKLNLGKNLLHGGGLSNFWIVKTGVDFVRKLRVGTKCYHLSWILYKNILIE